MKLEFDPSGTVTVMNDVPLGRATHRMEMDLARAHRTPDGRFEFQFVQLRPMSSTKAAYYLAIRMDETQTAARRQSQEWTTFREDCNAFPNIRTPEEVESAFAALDFEGAQTMVRRAIVDRMSRFGSHATAAFATIDGSEIANIAQRTTSRTTVTMQLESVVEVTMDAPVMSEFIESIHRVLGQK